MFTEHPMHSDKIINKTIQIQKNGLPTQYAMVALLFSSKDSEAAKTLRQCGSVEFL